ncbi:alkylphosphonate utilization protein [Phaeovibrio sulfidiphilus]|uniref:Alkylphosphonate utilization protein n=1 Tax=Phaeovibrio sulfidiphilus TaxID=1220600 RepID=A0A8J6YPJ3_9PROT|nr:zinc ribbon domain-containing protein YjdM [Phaeovibrio sulfidiphilus]MBE1236877.1 alkylphosphonate utilization protein [Phaeovibrio sulfidiphilus]
MADLPPCPECRSEYVYADGELLICPECSHEWNPSAAPAGDDAGAPVVRDAFGTVLADGDAVVLVKDLKVRGASAPLKQGTRVKSIRLVDGDHNIDCQIDGFGAMALKSEFVKKA